MIKYYLLIIVNELAYLLTCLLAARLAVTAARARARVGIALHLASALAGLLGTSAEALVQVHALILSVELVERDTSISLAEALVGVADVVAF